MARREVGAVEDSPAGTLKRVVVDGIAVCVAHAADDKLYAIADECTHEGASLSEGELWGTEVECARHVSRFDLRNGAVSSPPADTPVQAYDVTIENGVVYVEIARTVPM